MKQTEIIENNKLIAKFMNIELLNHWDDAYSYAKEVVWDFNDEFYDCSSPELLGFHNSWDWLMPVVEKIESLGYFFKISTKMCAVSRDNKGDSDSYLVKAQFGDFSKLQKTYSCVIAFIKYVNYLSKNEKNNKI